MSGRLDVKEGGPITISLVLLKFTTMSFSSDQVNRLSKHVRLFRSIVKQFSQRDVHVEVVERAVSQQLHHYLAYNDLLPRYQSAYRRHHSTETAMLRVLSDVLTAADNQQVTLLGLLDLSAAFDCVDHQLLLQRLRRDFGFSKTVLAWTTSIVTGRTQQLPYKGCFSAVQPVQYGVPQGSVRGPILFVLYTAEIGRIVAQHGLKFHQYADDRQIYVATSVSEVHSVIDQLSRCLRDVDVTSG